MCLFLGAGLGAGGLYKLFNKKKSGQDKNYGSDRPNRPVQHNVSQQQGNYPSQPPRQSY